MLEILMNNELEMIWKGEVAASFEVESLHLPEETKNNSRKFRIVGVSAKIRTENVPSTGQKGHRMSQIARLLSNQQTL
jgi:hypothetical protein